MNLENPYILLTPGPLSTSPTVRQAMLRDWCTWDDDYNLGVVTPIREGLIALATSTRPQDYTAVLMQGSGTFSVEAMIGTAVPRDGRLLVLANGEYGNRLGRIAITHAVDLRIPPFPHFLRDPHPEVCLALVRPRHRIDLVRRPEHQPRCAAEVALERRGQ